MVLRVEGARPDGGAFSTSKTPEGELPPLKHQQGTGVADSCSTTSIEPRESAKYPQTWLHHPSVLTQLLNARRISCHSHILQNLVVLARKYAGKLCNRGASPKLLDLLKERASARCRVHRKG